MERRDCPAGNLSDQDAVGYYHSNTPAAFEYTRPGCQIPTASILRLITEAGGWKS